LKFLEANFVGEMKKLEKLGMMLVLHAMNSDFNHICHQILTGHEIPSKENLTTRLFRVPTLKNSGSSSKTIKFSTMVSTWERRGCGIR